jgi:serine/threonine protein kinase
MDLSRFLKNVLKNSHVVPGEKQQARIYEFTINKHEYVLKHYHQYENYEGEILSRLKHPSIVECYGHGLLDGKQFVILEYCKGKSLAELQSLTVEQAEQLHNVLVYLKNNDVTHREINPDHIIITEKGIKLIDFGCATIKGQPMKFNVPTKEINRNYGVDDEEAVRMIVEKFTK